MLVKPRQIHANRVGRVVTTASAAGSQRKQCANHQRDEAAPAPVGYSLTAQSPHLFLPLSIRMRWQISHRSFPKRGDWSHSGAFLILCRHRPADRVVLCSAQRTLEEAGDASTVAGPIEKVRAAVVAPCTDPDLLGLARVLVDLV